LGAVIILIILICDDRFYQCLSDEKVVIVWCNIVATGRSRSAPARGYLSDSAYRTRPWPALLDQPVEIKVYDVDDVERLARWRAQETEVRTIMLKLRWFDLLWTFCTTN